MQTVGSPGLWIGFTLFVLAMLALDLGVFHRSAHKVSFREAAIWSAVWIFLSLVFGAGVYWKFGPAMGLQYLTGYVIEKALSVDNIFVILVIMAFFAVPARFQHKVLFWGILGALVMRAAFIFAGAALLQRFHWVMYVFGAVLVVTAVRLLLQNEEEVAPDKNPIVKLVKRWVPMVDEYRDGRFFVVENGKRLATPLFLVLVTVEATDVVFAVDSIPAIFAISQDPFIVYTSNIFAILGLRSLFFLLAGVMGKFHLLKYGLAAVLLFVGVKMLIVDWLKVPIGVSLVVVATLIGGAVAASLAWPPASKPQAAKPPPEQAKTGTGER
ncbi:MAG: TerC family protein [Myxococcota bacterium]